MKIAIIGYGKMGHTIEQIAIQRGHEIVLIVSSKNQLEMTIEKLQNADVAIEFTNPHSAKENVLKCIEAGIAVVSGSTGWNEAIHLAAEKTIEKQTSFIHSSNFSIGVNLFFEINNHLAKIMNDHKEYKVSVEEIHHTQKKDAPSGTALTIAQQLINNIDSLNQWELNNSKSPGTIPIFAHRIDNINGTHKVKFSSLIDDIEIIHTAHSRDGFALGAILAAEFIFGKQGNFTMNDVLGIK